MENISEQYSEYQEWYFEEMDRRMPSDEDENWIIIDCLMQMYGQGLSGGISLYCAGNLKSLDNEVAILARVNLNDFARLLQSAMAVNDASGYDEYFLQHGNEIHLAAYNHAVACGLYIP